MSTETIVTRFDPKPGIVREVTRYAASGYWYDGDKIRFKNGKPENIRGWQRKVSSTFTGTGRDVTTWISLEGSRYIAWGTENRLWLYHGGTNYDITPVRTSATLTGTFNASIGSTSILVSAPAHGIINNAYFYVVTASAFAGVSLSGNTYYASVVDANIFTFDVSAAAAATSISTGNATVDYLLNVGASIAYEGLGYGTGSYSSYTYGTARPSSNIFFDIQQWSLCNWGEDLIANQRGGRIYTWVEASGGTPSTRAVVVTAAPTISNFTLISPLDRHMISLGCTDQTGAYDPMLIRWCNQEDYTNWVASVSSTAGDQRVTDGSKLVGGINAKDQVLVWTDTALYSMSFIGPPFVFSIQQLGSNCGMAAPHGAVEFNGSTYWWGTHSFFKYDGRVQVLPCSVQRYVFEDYNPIQHDKVFAGVNEEFGEVIWLYPSANATECDRYVVYNTLDGSWYFGTAKWTVWEDAGIFTNVITLGSDNYVYDNEVDGLYTADGAAYESYIESADFVAGEGDQVLFSDRIIPDMTVSSGTATIRVVTKKYPNGPETSKGPYTITTSTGKISTRLRGRHLRFRVGSSVSGTKWRLGSMRFDFMNDGPR